MSMTAAEILQKMISEGSHIAVLRGPTPEYKELYPSVAWMASPPAHSLAKFSMSWLKHILSSKMVRKMRARSLSLG